MADIMSIPAEIKYKEMLSHTFPGFFLASSIFMLIDYLSPDNLTAWAIGSLTNLVTFAGFIIIIGTILGVIIDGIHHTFIEDDIFDNFKEIHKLKKPINEQLKANCPAYSNNLTRHFFFSKIGANGANATQLENHLDEAYYRYSEFYSNIFISLTFFSIISPFYIFEVLDLPWKTSVLIGIASLLASGLCLASSYTSYKMYLQAQCSAICGFIQDPKMICGLNCQEEPTNPPEDWDLISLKRFKIIPISLASISIIIIILDLQPDIIWFAYAIYAIIVGYVTEILACKYIFQGKSDKNEKDFCLLTNIKKIYSDTIDIVDNLLKSEETNYDRDKNVDKIEDSLNVLKANNKSLEVPTIEYNKTKVNGLTENIQNIIKYININEKNNKEKLDIQLSKAKKIQMIMDNPKKPDNGNILSKLSRSSPAALFSVMLNIFLALMILLLSSGAPINLHVETTNIKFNENISSETAIKNPVETLSLKNKGDRLNNISLSINGIANNWLDIGYIKGNQSLENLNDITLNPGETKFVQIRLNSSGIDRKNISQGSYIGSIDINYSNRMKSIPLCINLTKK